ncbi:unnamed protein product [Nezara viridula]|uniref:Neuropeptide n=1 Tax=Nezara viridula TaxID=85310 RepID=A0A9P0EDY8_NEZVI|nr:unnamed protein product [Nezara viridula]
MTMDRWTISLILLNAFISSSQENEINTVTEGYDQGNLQNDGPPETMVLPQDCFEVCNDYECLYLCPRPLRGIKRCITPLKSNKKNCCQNGQINSSNAPDNLKTAGKHIWQAREQLLGIKKEIENDLANRRYSLIKGLQPFSIRQHNRDSLFKLGTKTSKPKGNAVKLVCPVNDKKTTNLPNNFVNTNNEVSGGVAGDLSENQISQKLPYYEKDLSKEDEIEHSDYNDEVNLATTMIPMLRNENIEDIREQVSTPNSYSSLEEKEEMQNSFTDVSGDIRILESEHTTYDTDLPKSSINYKHHNSPSVEQSNRENFSNRPSPSLNSNTDQPHYTSYEETVPNGVETQTMGQNIFQSHPIIFYGDPYSESPMEFENSVLSQTNRDNLLFTTPSMHEHSSSHIKKSSPNTAENIKTLGFNFGETSDNPESEFEVPISTTPGTTGYKQIEINDNILVESKNEFIVNDSKTANSSGRESLSSLTKEGSSEANIANNEELTSLETDVVDEKIATDSLKRVLTKSYLRSEEDEHQSLTPDELNKPDVNVLLSNETGVRNEIYKLNTSENNFYVERDNMEGSSNKLKDTEHIYDYPNDEPSPNANDYSEKKKPISEMNVSSSGDGDKNSLLEILKLPASSNNPKQNYTYRMLQELIKKYNITSEIKSGGINSPECLPLNSSRGHETSTVHLGQKSPVINSRPNITGQSSDILQNKPNVNDSYSAIDNKTHGQYSSKPIIKLTNIGMSELDVENYTKKESIQMHSTTEINDQQLLSGPNNDSTRDIHESENIPVKSYSNIVKSYGPIDESAGSNDITHPNENGTTGLLETIPSITKGNKSDTIIGDNINGITSGNRMVINSSHPQVSRAEQATTASVYLIEKGSPENSSFIDDSQFGLRPNKLNKTIIHIKTNYTEEKMDNKNNMTENQFYVRKNIEPIFESNKQVIINDSINEKNNSKIVDQELLYDTGSTDSSVDEHIANISVTGSANVKHSNETDKNVLFDETVLQLMPNVTEMPLPTNFDDKSSEIKNHGIEEVHLRLEENNENSSRSVENDNNYDDLYRSKHSDEISTEINDSESYTLEDKREGSVINKKKLSDIINTELNSLKQQNIILKKREEEEEMPNTDDPQCDCAYQSSGSEQLDKLRQYADRPRIHPHSVYPMFIVVSMPYHVCDCENKTSYNNVNNNYINAPEPYVPREYSDTLTDYSFNSVHNHFQNGREGKAVQAPPYMPNLFLPFVPWGGMYTMYHPYHQVLDQPYDNYLQGRDLTNENDDSFNTIISNDHHTSGEGLENSNLGHMEEFQQDSVSTTKRSVPETQQLLRNERKDAEIRDYVFIDGQYVRVFKDDKENGNYDKTEETPITATEPPTMDTSTSAPYISTTQETVDEFVTNAAIDTHGHRPIDYFYPGDFGQNPFYGYYPGYVFTHH